MFVTETLLSAFVIYVFEGRTRFSKVFPEGAFWNADIDVPDA